ncbi:DUF4183 domain-containing protein [Paenibacillus sp. PAMC21692]|uniref:DUF4183 domain-containing protein n=1 Tax=Paenibacillus sp. PAMC21692 TaxID=2762320 RepID=UPI00164EC660|nr:DUF4183 domain-containing protein [Paenibacillus sp. PAMC21692]QNK58411.1 DUF4183 domain-containing protein [Paenibacillus sp. PAMC21692]
MKAVIASCARGRKGKLSDLKSGGKCKQGRKRRLLSAHPYYYYALGDGERRMFTPREAMPGYVSRIPDPTRVSLTNVFVDGMLQSPEVYAVYPGVLLFVSDQPPPEGSRIIAQFIVIKG